MKASFSFSNSTRDCLTMRKNKEGIDPTLKTVGKVG